MKPSPKSEPSPFERFDALARAVMAVPKSEVDKRKAMEKKVKASSKGTRHQ
jgi:hypothetical protein